mmetsp:Transcript_7782/g.8924  ORF Transcript_7782/g.8924 Transcript_7782/m.8924 type:complete len:344 (+) Transcript_7782:312-1343(+)
MSCSFNRTTQNLCTRKPYEDRAEAWVAGITGAVLLLNIVLLVWAVRRLRLTKAIFYFVLVLSIGAIFLLFSVITWPLNNTDSTCVAMPIFLAVGGGLMFGILVARICKVWYFFVHQARQPIGKIRKLKNSKVSKFDIFIVLGVVMVVETILLIVLFSVDDFFPVCECVPFREEDDYYTLCNFNTAFGGLVVMLNLFPGIVVLSLAYQTNREFRRLKGDTILGISKKEVDEFYPIIGALGIILLLFIAAASFTIVSGKSKNTRRNRQIYYVLRSLFVIGAVSVPVIILYRRRYLVHHEDRYSKSRAHVTTELHINHSRSSVRSIELQSPRGSKQLDSSREIVLT